MDPKKSLPWLLWDGSCGFCCWWVHWISSRGGRAVLRIVPYQDAPTPPMTLELAQRAAQAVVLILPDGTQLSAGRAVVGVLRELGWTRRAAVLESPLVLPMLEWLYRWVANHRPFLSRFASSPPHTCRDALRDP